MTRIGVHFRQAFSSIDELRDAWRRAEGIGLESIWLWDHLMPMFGDPKGSNFEAYTLLAAMATDTRHARIGALVTCNQFRNPNLLADMSRTIDHLSGGRFVLGIGSGYHEGEHADYGFEWGTAQERSEALAASLPIIRDRLAKLHPGPVRGHLPILVGGSGERVTLRLAVEHGDGFNTLGTVEHFARKNAVVDQWCAELGRDPATIERTVLVEANADVQAYVDAGAETVIVGSIAPFDLSKHEEIVTRFA